MKKFKTIALTITLSLFSINSFAKDVISTGSEFVKVTKSGELRKFELCNVQKKICRLLGEREYKISELENLYTKLAWETGGSAVVSLLGLACAGMGVITGLAAIEGAALFTAGADLAAAGVGVGFIAGSAGGTFLAITSKYNPVSLYKRMDSVDSNVVEDKTVSISGGNTSIEDFAMTLDESLREI